MNIDSIYILWSACIYNIIICMCLSMLIIISQDDNINCYRYYCLNKNVGDLCYCMANIARLYNQFWGYQFENCSILLSIWD